MTGNAAVDARWLMIGTVGKPHGLRGAFFVSGRSEPIPEGCVKVVLGNDPAGGETLRVAAGSLLRDRPVMALTKFSDRTTIEAMRGVRIWIPRSVLPVNDLSEYLWADVIGSEVIDAAGISLGRVIDMVNYGASDIAVVADDHGARLDLPFVDVYVDMSFRPTDKRITLLVESAVLEDFWQRP